MKKVLTSVFVLIMLFTVCASCLGCNPSEQQVAAPQLSLSGSIAYWNITDDATEYNVYVDGVKVASQIGVRYNLSGLEVGTHSVQVTVVVGGVESEKSNTVTFVKESNVNEQRATVFQPVTETQFTYSGILQSVFDTTMRRQLLDRELWATCVNQFRPRTNGNGETYYVDDVEQGEGGWRGEFWGKLMVGACLMYDQTKDANLYAILEETTRDLLTTQESDGRIGSYNRISENPGSHEFYDWDLWCRKHVLGGMEAFYDICQDESLKAQLIESMLKQVDYILQYVGDGDDKLNITEAGSKYGGLNSSTILNKIIELYKLTGEQRVLDFATHIIGCGGSSITNLIDRAIDNTSFIYTWGTPKAYEMTDFFEGVIDYYLITGITKYRTAAINYAYALVEQEMVLTGGCGYNSEEFNHSSVDQANPTNRKVSLETCVTTAIMNFLNKAYLVTGDPYFIDALETTVYNQIIGATDLDGCFDHAFTSYFNLMFSTRCRSSAGGMDLDGQGYGCCIAYGATAVGRIHTLQYVSNNDTVVANFYFPGSVSFATPKGNRLSISTATNYPYSNSVKMKLSLDAEEEFQLKLRIPAWSTDSKVTVNGVAISGATAGEYFTLLRTWKDGDEIVVNFNMNPRLYQGSAECVDSNAQYNCAVLYGPLVLARDARLGEDIFQTVNIKTDETGKVLLTPTATATFTTQAEFEVQLTDGTTIHMVDFASAGKTYREDSLYTVFMPTTDYWKQNNSFDVPVVLACVETGIVLSVDETGQLGLGMFATDYATKESFQSNQMTFDDRGNGYYSFRPATSDDSMAFEVGSDNRLHLVSYNGSDKQLFKINRVGLYNYTIACKANNNLISQSGEEYCVHVYPDCDSAQQRWYIVVWHE